MKYLLKIKFKVYKVIFLTVCLHLQYLDVIAAQGDFMHMIPRRTEYTDTIFVGFVDGHDYDMIVVGCHNCFTKWYARNHSERILERM